MLTAVRAHLIITGVVQGVYYRVTAREKARTLDITGWVKNRPDRAVEAVAEGNMENVVKFIDWCRQGPPASKVSHVEVTWEDFRAEFKAFEIID